MRKLKRIILINFAMFEAQEIDIDGNTAILGANRAGKSTLLDALQIVLSGAQFNDVRFNAAAAAEGGRTKRTALSYCLGDIDDQPIRAQCRTYIAVVFEATEGHPLPVTLGVSLDARAGQASPDKRGLFILSGLDTRLSHFQDFLEEDNPDKWKPYDYADLRTLLENEAARFGGNFTSHASGGANFVKDYMRLLFTPSSGGDHQQLIKSIVNAMAFKDMKSVTDFVTKFLLEPKPVVISALRDSIQTYRETAAEIDKLDRQLTYMRELQSRAKKYGDTLASVDDYNFTTFFCRGAAARIEYRSNILRLQELADEISVAEARSEHLSSHRGELQERLDECKAQRAASGFDAKIEAQTQLRDRHEHRKSVALEGLSDFYLSLSKARPILVALETTGAFSSLSETLATLYKVCRPEDPTSWPANAGLVDRLVAEMSSEITKAFEYFEQEVSSALLEREEINQDLKSVEASLSRLESDLASLDPQVIAMINELESRGISSRVLAECVEVTDPEWRDAVEAILGRDRQTIFVDASQVDEVIRLKRSSGRMYRQVTIANTRKMQDLSTDRVTIKSNSVASVLTSNDDEVMRFIGYRIGNVRKADSQADLHRPGRAIMKDGTYDDGIAVHTRTVPDRLIGKAARALELQRLSNEKARLETQRIGVLRGIEDGKTLTRIADSLTEINPSTLQFSELRNQHDDANERIAECDQAIADLKNRVDPNTEAQIHKYTAEISEIDKEINEANKSVGGIKERKNALSDLIDSGEGIFGSKEHRNLHWNRAVRAYHDLPRLPGLMRKMHREIAKELVSPKDYDDLLRGPISSQVVGRIADKANEKENLLRNQATQIREAIRAKHADYIRLFGENDQFPIRTDESTNFVSDIRTWVENDIERIETTDLPRFRDQAAKAADEAETMFKESFLHSIGDRCAAARSEIEKINDALRTRLLGKERYRLRLIPKDLFQDILDLAKDAKTDDGIKLPLFTPQEDLEDAPIAHRKAIDAVQRILMDPGFDFTPFEDYRSYFTYELYMKNLETGRETAYTRRRGIGSGAEVQVPFYVIMGAALANIYHGFSTATDTRRGAAVTLFDEAFSKLDGNNQRTLLDFYRDIGLQVIVAAPSDRRHVLQETLECIVDVVRPGNGPRSECDVTFLRPRFRDELHAANPDNMSDEVIRSHLEGTNSNTPVDGHPRSAAE